MGRDNVSDLSTYDMCPAIYITESSGIFMINCTISDYVKVEFGAGLYIYSSTVSLTDTIIESNSGKSGGALAVVFSSSVTLDNCIIRNNEAEEGSCVYITNYSTVTSTDCTFSNNTAENSAVFQAILSGKILDTGSSMTDNIATSANSIGLFLDSTGSIFDGTIMTNNSMQTLDSTPGRCIYMIQSSAVFENSVVTNSQTIYVILSNLTIDNCTFQDDPTLYTDDQASAISGGFIYLADASLAASASSFYSGLGGYGGAIFTTLSTVSITTSLFDSNHATKNGGGIYLTDNKLVDIHSTIFRHNTAVIGDAIELEGSTGSDTIINCTFESSSSPSFMYFSSADVEVSDSTFQQTDNNIPDQLSEEDLNKLRKAGAILAEGNSKLLITNNTFRDFLISYGMIYITEIQRGSIQTSTQYELSQNRFISNTAYSTLGGTSIYLSNPINAKITGNHFEQNSALNGDGGAIKYY